MLIVVPQLGAQAPFLAGETATAFVHEAALQQAASPGLNSTLSTNRAIDALKSQFRASLPLTGLRINGTVYMDDDEALSSLRSTEVVFVELVGSPHDGAASISTVATFSDRLGVKADAELSIGLTVFVTVVLALGALLLSHDTTELVVQPMERMISVARRILDNPLVPYDASAEEEATNSGGFETNRLVAVLLNVPRLLKVAFGHAGASALVAGLTQSGELDLASSGRLSDAVLLHVRFPSLACLSTVLRGSSGPVINGLMSMIHADGVAHSAAVLESRADSCLLVWELVERDVSDEEARATIRHYATPGGLLEGPEQLAVSKRRILRQRAVAAALSCGSHIIMRCKAFAAGGGRPRPGAATPLARASPDAALAAAAMMGRSFAPQAFCSLHTGRLCTAPVGSVHQVALVACGVAGEQARLASAAAARLGHPLVVTAQAFEAMGTRLRAELRPLLRIRPRRWGVRSVQETGGFGPGDTVPAPRSTSFGDTSAASSDGRRSSLQHALRPKASFRQLAGESFAHAGFGGSSRSSEQAVLSYLAPRPLGPTRLSSDTGEATGGREADASSPFGLLGLDADWDSGLHAAGLDRQPAQSADGDGISAGALGELPCEVIDWSVRGAVRDALLSGSRRERLKSVGRVASFSFLGWPAEAAAEVQEEPDVQAALRMGASAENDPALWAILRIHEELSGKERLECRSRGWVWLDVDA